MQNRGRHDKPEATLNPVKNSTLQRVYRIVLASLALFAAVIWAAGAPGGSAAMDRRFTLAAFGLAAASILLRRAVPTTRPRSDHLGWLLVSMLLAAGVGLVGVALAVGGGPRGVALLYVLGAVILSLRPPPTVAEKA
jgi:peptidoglycan/LPS O-acetylase OafA/YrhL